MKTYQQTLEYANKALLSSQIPNACNCIGPQDGQPVCPCRMRSVKIVHGRYVQVIDLGPVAEVDRNDK